MGIINRSGIYYAEFFDATRIPKAKRFSLRTRSKTRAWKSYLDLDRAWSDGAFDPWTDNPRFYDQKRQKADRWEAERPRTLGAAIDAFLEGKRKAGRTVNTIRTYGEVLSLAIREAGADLPIGQLACKHLEPLFTTKTVSAATRHKRFGHLRTFVRWLVKEGFISTNPLDGVEPPRKAHKLPKAVTEDELDAVCSAIQKEYERLRAGEGPGERRSKGDKKRPGSVLAGHMIWRIPLFRFAFCTGMRASELARLRWRDIDFERRLIYIRKQKNHREQTIPLNGRAAALLELVRPGSVEDYVFRSPRENRTSRSTRSFVTRASRAFREGRQWAEIDRNVSFHGLRHGFCSRLAEARKPLYVIKEAARHADVSTSLIYVHMANEHLKSELDDVFDN